MARGIILSIASWGVVALLTTACSSTPPAPAQQWLPEPSYDGFESAMTKIKRPPPIVKEYYPVKSKSLGHYGRVWLGYSVNAQGKAERISLVQTDFDDLSVGAVAQLRDLEFSVDRDWDNIGGPSRRYCMAIVFVLADKPPPPMPRTETIVITASHLVSVGVRSTR